MAVKIIFPRPPLPGLVACTAKKASYASAGKRLLTATKIVWIVGQGRKNLSFLSVTQCAYYFSKSTKDVFSLQGACTCGPLQTSYPLSYWSHGQTFRSILPDREIRIEREPTIRHLGIFGFDPWETSPIYIFVICLFRVVTG